jgi:hypothetical protein
MSLVLGWVAGPRTSRSAVFTTTIASTSPIHPNVATSNDKNTVNDTCPTSQVLTNPVLPEVPGPGPWTSAVRSQPPPVGEAATVGFEARHAWVGDFRLPKR